MWRRAMKLLAQTMYLLAVRKLPDSDGRAFQVPRQEWSRPKRPARRDAVTRQRRWLR